MQLMLLLSAMGQVGATVRRGSGGTTIDSVRHNAEAETPELIRAVEDGETVVITRQGRAVAQLTSPPSEPRQVQFDSMRDRIELLPGWDDPVDLARFLVDDL